MSRVLAGAAAVGILALVVLAWPRASDVEVRAAYVQLQASPVPVLAIGWISPVAARADVSNDGYTLIIRDSAVGDLTIRGNRGRETAAGAGSLVWHVGDVEYTTDATLGPRVVPLAEAKRQLTGSEWDTPVLYGFYLPLLIGFLGWAVVSLFTRP